MRFCSILLVLGLAIAISLVTGDAFAAIEGPGSQDLLTSIEQDGSWQVGYSWWAMYGTNNPTVDLPARGTYTTLPNSVPEYHWWNGCSPTAAGMLFAYWDTHLGKENLYVGDSSVWDEVNMNKDNPAHYTGTHNIVASWGHKQAGTAKGLTYGSWDRNGNGIVDDQAQWDCLADFMQTEDGGTWRSNMAQGFLDYAEWDNPATPESESYINNSSWTDDSPTWAEYTAEIDAGYPVHVGITGHSILGFGYYTGTTPWDPTTRNYVLNWTTWGGGWDDYWGLVAFDEVYAYTLLRVGDQYVVPEFASIVVWSLLGTLGIAFNRYRRRRSG